MSISKEKGQYFQEKWEEMEYRFANVEMKQKIEKAIEYIEKRKQEREKANKYAYDIRNDDFIKYCNIELDILKGEDKE